MTPQPESAQSRARFPLPSDEYCKVIAETQDYLTPDQAVDKILLAYSERVRPFYTNCRYTERLAADDETQKLAQGRVFYEQVGAVEAVERMLWRKAQKIQQDATTIGPAEVRPRVDRVLNDTLPQVDVAVRFSVVKDRVQDTVNAGQRLPNTDIQALRTLVDRLPGSKRAALANDFTANLALCYGLAASTASEAEVISRASERSVSDTAIEQAKAAAKLVTRSSLYKTRAENLHRAVTGLGGPTHPRARQLFEVVTTLRQVEAGKPVDEGKLAKLQALTSQAGGATPDPATERSWADRHRDVMSNIEHRFSRVVGTDPFKQESMQRIGAAIGRPLNTVRVPVGEVVAQPPVVRGIDRKPPAPRGPQPQKPEPRVDMRRLHDRTNAAHIAIPGTDPDAQIIDLEAYRSGGNGLRYVATGAAALTVAGVMFTGGSGVARAAETGQSQSAQSKVTITVDRDSRHTGSETAPATTDGQSSTPGQSPETTPSAGATDPSTANDNHDGQAAPGTAATDTNNPASNQSQPETTPADGADQSPADPSEVVTDGSEIILTPIPKRHQGDGGRHKRTNAPDPTATDQSPNPSPTPTTSAGDPSPTPTTEPTPGVTPTPTATPGSETDPSADPSATPDPSTSPDPTSPEASPSPEPTTTDGTDNEPQHHQRHQNDHSNPSPGDAGDQGDNADAQPPKSPLDILVASDGDIVKPKAGTANDPLTVTVDPATIEGGDPVMNIEDAPVVKSMNEPETVPPKTPVTVTVQAGSDGVPIMVIDDKPVSHWQSDTSAAADAQETNDNMGGQQMARLITDPAVPMGYVAGQMSEDWRRKGHESVNRPAVQQQVGTFVDGLEKRGVAPGQSIDNFRMLGVNALVLANHPELAATMDASALASSNPEVQLYVANISTPAVATTVLAPTVEGAANYTTDQTAEEVALLANADALTHSLDEIHDILLKAGVIKPPEAAPAATEQGDASDGGGKRGNDTAKGDPTDRAIEAMSQKGGVWENIAVALQFYMDHGYTLAQASGIVANFRAESGVDPTKQQNGGGPGRAIGQWEEGGRYDELLRFAQNRGLDPNQLLTQLKFSVYELNGGESRANELLKKADTPEEAALIVSKFYERPNPDYAHNDLRMQFARGINDIFVRKLESAKADDLAKAAPRRHLHFETRRTGYDVTPRNGMDAEGFAPNLRTVNTAIEKEFPFIHGAGGVCPGGCTSGHMPGSDHYSGHAADYDLDPRKDPINFVRQQDVVNWLIANANEYNIKYIICNNQIWSEDRADEGWRTYSPPEGSTNDYILLHYEHVHLSVY